MTSGKPVEVRAAIDLAGLTPGDVRVELVLGRIDNNGNLEETEVMVLPAVRAGRIRRHLRKRDYSGADRKIGICVARQPESF